MIVRYLVIIALAVSTAVVGAFSAGVVSPAHAEAKDAAKIPGLLLFADPLHIKLWDLGKDKLDTLWENPSRDVSSSIQGLTIVDRSAVIFGMESSGIKNLHRLDLSTGKQAKLRTGTMPFYVQKHRALLFFDRDTDKGQWGLYSFDPHADTQDAKLIKQFEGHGVDALPPVALDQDTIMFSSGTAADGVLSYNLATAKVAQLTKNGIEPMGFNSRTREIIGVDGSTLSPLALKPENDQLRHLRLSENIPIVYVPGMNSFIGIGGRFGILPFGEQTDTWFYSVDTGVGRRLRKQQALWRESTAWLDIDASELDRE